MAGIRLFPPPCAPPLLPSPLLSHLQFLEAGWKTKSGGLWLSLIKNKCKEGLFQAPAFFFRDAWPFSYCLLGSPSNLCLQYAPSLGAERHCRETNRNHFPTGLKYHIVIAMGVWEQDLALSMFPAGCCPVWRVSSAEAGDGGSEGVPGASPPLVSATWGPFCHFPEGAHQRQAMPFLTVVNLTPSAPFNTSFPMKHAFSCCFSGYKWPTSVLISAL